jgi:hypothetical protein
MARRRIKHIRVGQRCSVDIYRDSSWDEFVVVTHGRIFRSSPLKPATYHTTDKRDARSTAAHQIKILRRSGWCR